MRYPLGGVPRTCEPAVLQRCQGTGTGCGTAGWAGQTRDTPRSVQKPVAALCWRHCGPEGIFGQVTRQSRRGRWRGVAAAACRRPSRPLPPGARLPPPAPAAPRLPLAWRPHVGAPRGRRRGEGGREGGRGLGQGRALVVLVTPERVVVAARSGDAGAGAGRAGRPLALPRAHGPPARGSSSAQSRPPRRGGPGRYLFEYIEEDDKCAWMILRN